MNTAINYANAKNCVEKWANQVLSIVYEKGGRLVQKILTSKKLVIRYSQTSVGGGITFKFTVHFGGQLHGKSIFYVYI